MHFLALGTPSGPGGAADLSQLHAAIDCLAPLLTEPCLVVGKSTVPVGTALQLEQRLRAQAPAGDQIEVAWNPEFLREAFAVEDTLRPDRLVFGTQTARALEVLEQIYAIPLTEPTPVVRCDIATAELIKVAANSFLATKISFINAMAQMCQAAGGDVTLLADAIGYDKRIGREFLNAGLGFGGGCLPKDIKALAVRADELGVHVLSELIHAVEAINDGPAHRARRAGHRPGRRRRHRASGSPCSARPSSRAPTTPGTPPRSPWPTSCTPPAPTYGSTTRRPGCPPARASPRSPASSRPSRRRGRAAPDRVARVPPARPGEARRSWSRTRSSSTAG